MPQMVFEYILKKQGIDPKKDLTIIQNIDFGLTSQAFSSGEADYTIEFEPAATALELEGVGKVVASLGVESGKVPYTTFAVKKSYLEKNADVLQSFTNAVQKGLDYVLSHTPEEIAKIIQPQFAETDKDKLVMIITRYYEQDTWKDNLVFEKESLTLLQDILDEAGELKERVPYEEIVTTEFATKADK
jgi:NitT/TauT family transport system substrate-binding protein